MHSVPRGTGSGFVWDEQGHVVTNLHVIAGAADATVQLADGRDYATTWSVPVRHVIHGAEIDSVGRLASLLDDRQVGDAVRLRIWREGKTLDVTVSLQSPTQPSML